MKGGVVPPGIEPGTHGFSVRCSTNSAKAPYSVLQSFRLRLQRYYIILINQTNRMKKCYLLTNFKNFRPFCLHLPLFLRLFCHYCSGFQPCAFSGNSWSSRVTSTCPRLSFVMCPMRRTSSMAWIFSWSPIGMVNSNS